MEEKQVVEEKQAGSIEKIQEIQEQYYSAHRKNFLFKNGQKVQCAQMVASQIPMEVLLEKTFYVIPNSNRMYVSYPLFKSFVSAEIYRAVIDHIINLGRVCIQSYKSISVHINGETFTPTAAHRYKDFLSMLLKTCEKENTRFSLYLENMCIYNCPKLAESIASILWNLLPRVVQNKVRLFNKEESQEHISQLLGERT